MNTHLRKPPVLLNRFSIILYSSTSYFTFIANRVIPNQENDDNHVNLPLLLHQQFYQSTFLVQVARERLYAMRTYFLLPHLLSNALVAANDQARAFPVDSSIPIETTCLEIEHEHTAQGRLGEMLQTKELKHSSSRDVQHQNIDHFDADKGNLVAKHSEPTTLSKSSTERSADLYALRVPFYDQEGYMALFLSNETAVPFCKDVSEALYDDSEKVFLHLDLRLGNSTTKIPVREDNAIGFCQKVKGKEHVGDASSAPTRTSSRITRSTAEVQLRGRPRPISRLSRALQRQHLSRRFQSLPKPSQVKLARQGR
jgi:hypothetical protein